MKTIAVIISDLFEDSEYTEPAKAFRDSGYELWHIGLAAGEKVKGKRKGTEVFVDADFSNADPSNYDALLIPGGYSPDKLRAHDSAVEFTKRFVESGKPVFVICHGPQILITADVIRGKKITGWKSVIKDIENAGAEFIDKEVVIDGNIISSRSPDDLPAFISAALKKLKETE